MNATGFICLYRQITQWEWYKNPNTFRLFIHLLLMANYADGRFEGEIIKRGEYVTSLPSLADQTSLTIQQARTALDHLKSTGEITDRKTNRYRVITIVNYDRYQIDNRQNNRPSTGDQQADQQQYNKDNKETNNNIILLSKNNKGKFIPPTADDINQYCEEKGIYGFDADYFIDYYESRGWMIGKNKMKDWKAAIRTWLRRDQERREQERHKYDELPF